MKKLCLILVLCLTLSSLSGCGSSAPQQTAPPVTPLSGEPAMADTSEMERYDLACGLTLYAAPNLTEMEREDMAGYLYDELFLIMIIEEPKEGSLLADKDLQGYADLVTTQNRLTPCVTDAYGSLATTYLVPGNNNLDYFYYMTVKETASSFWLVQITCQASGAATYLDTFAQWASTIVPTAEAE